MIETNDLRLSKKKPTVDEKRLIIVHHNVLPARPKYLDNRELARYKNSRTQLLKTYAIVCPQNERAASVQEGNSSLIDERASSTCTY